VGRNDLSPWDVFYVAKRYRSCLKPSAAESYPYLPARMWTPARGLAELVAKYRGIPADAVDRIDQVLSDRDFMFRSGATAEVH
jgi:hypothetical protein